MKKHKFQALMAWNAAQSQVKDLMEALGPYENKPLKENVPKVGLKSKWNLLLAN